MAGLAILKHTYNLSDEVVCELWIENPYYQYFCGEEFFQHRLPLDRSSMTHWRNRMGEERLQALLQESLAVGDPDRRDEAGRTVPRHRRYHGAAEEHRLPDRRQAVEPGPREAGDAGQKAAAWSCASPTRGSASSPSSSISVTPMPTSSGAPDKALRKLKTYLGRVIRDIARKIDGAAGWRPRSPAC